jgi:hypothetical protein
MAAGALISLVMFALLGTSEQYMDRYESLDSRISLDNSVLLASDSLVLTGGSPGNWSETVLGEGNLTSFGLASAPNVIDYAKAARMQQISQANYTEVRRALGLSRSSVSIRIFPLGSNEPHYSFGVEPAPNATVAVSERVVVLNGSIALLRLSVG